MTSWSAALPESGLPGSCHTSCQRPCSWWWRLISQSCLFERGLAGCLCRSPWRLVRDSPLSQQQQLQQQQQASPLGRTSPSHTRRTPAGAASPAAGVAGGWAQLQQQLLVRCRSEEGGVRVTAVMRRQLPPAQPAPAATAAAAAAVSPPLPALPPVSLPAAAKPAASAKPPLAGEALWVCAVLCSAVLRCAVLCCPALDS